MITLLGKAASRSGRCLWALEELGVEYQHNPLDYAKGDAKTDSFKTINPGAKIPALTDDTGGRTVAMFESLAINQYLAQEYGKGSLWPDDAGGQAACMQWTLWSATEMEPPAAARLVEFIFKSEADRSQEALDAAAEKSKAPLDTLEASLQGSDYLGGDTFTVADLNAACSVEYLARTKFDLSAWPKVEAWITRCLDRPAYAAAADIKAKEMA